MPPESPTPPSPPSRRLLSGAGELRGPAATRTRTATATQARSPAEPPRRAVAAPPAPAPQGLPRWAKGVVIGGVLLAVAMPASVLLSRSMLVQSMMQDQGSSSAALICKSGEARANDDSGLLGWLFGGSYFQCSEWETREARLQREREQYEANYLARQRAKQQSY
ncbi:MAG: hypothetical protein GXC94_01170 [Comamonadaceae bacterium]|nr:hypothetical protein [Comamonadaceae bacterium]